MLFSENNFVNRIHRRLGTAYLLDCSLTNFVHVIPAGNGQESNPTAMRESDIIVHADVKARDIRADQKGVRKHVIPLVQIIEQGLEFVPSDTG